MRTRLLVAAALAVGCMKSPAPAQDLGMATVDCWDPSAPLPKVTILPSPLDFGTQAIDSTTAAEITVTNMETRFTTPAPYGYLGNVDGNSFAFAGAQPFPGAGGTCTSRLAAGESCTIALSFSPLHGGAYHSLLILYVDGSYCGAGGGGQPTPPNVGIDLVGTAN